MEFEFDKEIDLLLRQTAAGETVTNSGAHLDADEIALFAENALPKQLRLNAVAHFAECVRCRKILSNQILFSRETESENVRAPAVEMPAAPLPWYRKLFTFPQIAYAMGAFAVLFSGLIGYLVLQNRAGNSELAVVTSSEKPMNGKGMSSDGAATATNETFSSANVPANTAVLVAPMPGNSNMTSAANSAAPAARPNSNANANLAAPVIAERQIDEVRESPAAAKSEAENNFAVRAGTNSNTTLLNSPAATVAAAPPKDKSDDNEARRRTSESPAKAAKPENDAGDISLADSSQLPMNGRGVSPLALKSKKSVVNQPDETRAVGGKTFRRANGVWTDLAYVSQPQTSVSRSSKEYKKLDFGLRSIAETLGGTVVVVWKDKAYRIQ